MKAEGATAEGDQYDDTLLVCLAVCPWVAAAAAAPVCLHREFERLGSEK